MTFRTEGTVSFPRAAGTSDHTLRKVLISDYRDFVHVEMWGQGIEGQISALEGPPLTGSALEAPGVLQPVAVTLQLLLWPHLPAYLSHLCFSLEPLLLG